MIYCEFCEEFKSDNDTCFDFDKDEILLGFNKYTDFEHVCKNCYNREHE